MSGKPGWDFSSLESRFDLDLAFLALLWKYNIQHSQHAYLASQMVNIKHEILFYLYTEGLFLLNLQLNNWKLMIHHCSTACSYNL